MATLYPSIEIIERLTVPPTEGELYFLKHLTQGLDDSFEVYFNPFLDGDRPDIVILKKGHGAVIVEIKDWDLFHYSVDIKNRWFVHSNGHDYLIRSPFKQVFGYKSNMFDLHLPVLGVKEAINKNFYKVIDVFVYLHNTSTLQHKAFYSKAISSIDSAIKENNIQFKAKAITHPNYEKRDSYLSIKKKQIQRDMNMSILNDSIEKAVKKLNTIRPNTLFTDDVYLDFKRRLAPPESITLQGVEVVLDKKQERLSRSSQEFKKIKGVAGCGKTTILSKRAVNASIRHGSPVLVLTYNITLKPFIRDSIKRFSRSESNAHIDISNYHQFINSMLNEYNISTESFIENRKDKGLSEEVILDALYKNRGFFEGVEIDKYKTILIDEIQDYESEWVKIIRDFFLDDAGEMVLFGDQSQNIYQRDIEKRESSIVQGFGRWEVLSRSHRLKLDTPLVEMYKLFKQTYFDLPEDPVFDSSYQQGSMNYDLLKYEAYSGIIDYQNIFNSINQYIKAYDLVPNDIAIICSRISMVKKINELFLAREKTMSMVETQAELSEFKRISGEPTHQDILKLRRRKKTFFEQNSGLIKISTVHSFKGMESKTVFYIRYPGDGLKDYGDDSEMIYTAITRSRGNLVVFDSEASEYNDFFSKTLNI